MDATLFSEDPTVLATSRKTRIIRLCITDHYEEDLQRVSLFVFYHVCARDVVVFGLFKNESEQSLKDDRHEPRNHENSDEENDALEDLVARYVGLNACVCICFGDGSGLTFALDEGINPHKRYDAQTSESHGAAKEEGEKVVFPEERGVAEGDLFVKGAEELLCWSRRTPCS